MKTQPKKLRAAGPVALPGRLFAQIAQEAAAIGNRDLAIEFIGMAYLAFSGSSGETEGQYELGQLELTLTQQD